MSVDRDPIPQCVPAPNCNAVIHIAESLWFGMSYYRALYKAANPRMLWGRIAARSSRITKTVSIPVSFRQTNLTVHPNPTEDPVICMFCVLICMSQFEWRNECQPGQVRPCTVEEPAYREKAQRDFSKKSRSGVRTS